MEDEATWKVYTDEIQRIVIEEDYETHLWDRKMVHATSLNVKGYALDPTLGALIWKPNIGVEVWIDD